MADKLWTLAVTSVGVPVSGSVALEESGGLVWLCVSRGVAACCVAPLPAQRGLHWNQAGGRGAGIGLLWVSMATAGRSQETPAQEGRLQL